MEAQWLWLGGGVVLGIVLGVLIGRSRQRDASRLRELEGELETARAEHAGYRAEVSKHFEETSHRLRDLTLQYKSVYEHLADGARRLAPEGARELAPSLAEAALPAAAGGNGADDDAQLDLDLAAASWPGGDARTPRDGAAPDDDLGPLLDEETPAPPVAAR